MVLEHRFLILSTEPQHREPTDCLPWPVEHGRAPFRVKKELKGQARCDSESRGAQR